MTANSLRPTSARTMATAGATPPVAKRVLARSRRFALLGSFLTLAMASFALFAQVSSAQEVSFDRAFGVGVETGGSGFENCTTASGCQLVQSAAAGGMFGAQGVATDAEGRILVSDFAINRIARFTVAGDGTVAFDRAFGIDVDPSDGDTGDFENCTTASGCQAGTASDAAGGMDSPRGVAIDAQGGILVVDRKRIARFTVAGDGTVAFDRAFGVGVDTGGSGFENCTTASGCQAASVSGGAGAMDLPGSVATDAEGRILVSDQSLRRIARFTVAGDGTVAFDRAFGIDVDPSDGDTGDFENCTTASGCKSGTTSGAAGGMSAPQRVATDAEGRILVADYGNHRIARFTVAGDGTVAFDRAFGVGVDTGGSGFENCTTATTCQTGTTSGAAGGMNFPQSVATDAEGGILVASQFNYRIDRFTVAGDGTVSFDRAFGIGVDTGGSGFENCTTASGCQAGTQSAAAGGIYEGRDVTTDAEGRILVADIFRIARFNPPPPDPPTITDTDPDSPANDNNPKVKGTVGAGSPTQVKIYTNASCSGDPDATGTVAEFTGAGITVTVADNTTTALSARAANVAPIDSTCSGAFDYTEDSTPPDTTIDSGPTSPINTSQATFTFSGTPAGDTAKIQCKIDAGDFADCTSPKTFTGLTDGSHTATFRAEDALGNQDPTPVTRTFTVDTTPPDTTIDSGPSEPTGDATPSFEFSSEPGATFECRVDTDDFSSCSSPETVAALTDGSHTFEVRATDQVGNTDPTPATRSFTVDTTPPDTTIDSGPAGTITTDQASFTFSGDPASDTAKVQCKIDGQPFADCTSPKSFTGLSDGPHTATFRAEDAVGNQDPTPATRTFTVDTSVDPPVVDPPTVDPPVDPPPVGEAKIGKVKVTGPAKVKRGKKATYKVKVKNSGNAAATGVKLNVKGKGIKAKKSVGKIAAGKTKTVKVKLKPKKPGKVKASFKVSSDNAGGKTVKKTIRVRK